VTNGLFGQLTAIPTVIRIANAPTRNAQGGILKPFGFFALSVIVFEDATPISVKVFPVGASDITHDIALGLKISPEEAEQLKVGAVLGAPFPKRKIDDLIGKRVSEMFKLVEAHLKKIGKDELLPAGIILTGGGSSVQTMSDLAKAVLRLPSRVASLTETGASKLRLLFLANDLNPEMESVFRRIVYVL